MYKIIFAYEFRSDLLNLFQTYFSNENFNVMKNVYEKNDRQSFEIWNPDLEEQTDINKKYTLNFGFRKSRFFPSSKNLIFSHHYYTYVKQICIIQWWLRRDRLIWTLVYLSVFGVCGLRG